MNKGKQWVLSTGSRILDSDFASQAEAEKYAQSEYPEEFAEGLLSAVQLEPEFILDALPCADFMLEKLYDWADTYEDYEWTDEMRDEWDNFIQQFKEKHDVPTQYVWL